MQADRRRTHIHKRDRIPRMQQSAAFLINNATNIRTAWGFSFEKVPEKDFRSRNDGRRSKLVNMLTNVAARYILVLCANDSEKISHAWRLIDRSWSINFHAESELIMPRLKSTLQIRVGSNVINSRARSRNRSMYVTSAAVNLMIYTDGRKTNEWIHLARVRLTARLEINIHESSRE